MPTAPPPPTPTAPSTYVSNGDEVTTDSFQYTVNDNTGATSNTATVSITVNPTNDAPTAAGDEVETNEDTALSIDVVGLANDSDVDDLAVTIESGPTSGTLTDPDGDGVYTYTPNANFNGEDSFTYSVNDGTTDSNTATVSITVTPALPADVTYTQVAADHNHTVLLRSDGTAIAIGNNSQGQTDIPALPDGATYTQVTAGTNHTVLLRSDGTAIAIGSNTFGQTNIPAPPAGVTYTHVAAGTQHMVLLTAGTIASTL